MKQIVPYELDGEVYLLEIAPGRMDETFEIEVEIVDDQSDQGDQGSKDEEAVILRVKDEGLLKARKDFEERLKDTDFQLTLSPYIHF